jgi:hypothetical protein
MGSGRQTVAGLIAASAEQASMSRQRLLQIISEITGLGHRHKEKVNRLNRDVLESARNGQAEFERLTREFANRKASYQRVLQEHQTNSEIIKSLAGELEGACSRPSSNSMRPEIGRLQKCYRGAVEQSEATLAQLRQNVLAFREFKTRETQMLAEELARQRAAHGAELNELSDSQNQELGILKRVFESELKSIDDEIGDILHAGEIMAMNQRSNMRRLRDEEESLFQSHRRAMSRLEAIHSENVNSLRGRNESQLKKLSDGNHEDIDRQAAYNYEECQAAIYEFELEDSQLKAQLRQERDFRICCIEKARADRPEIRN